MKESQLDNKTTIATNDYVRMVDENNNSVKIKKNSFMAAIRDALPSIISDGETNVGSVLSIIDGALKTRTDANLASVLGVGKKILFDTNEDINDCMYGFYYTDKSSTTATIKNTPIEMSFGAISVASFVGEQDGYKTGFQICFPETNNNSADLYFRVCNSYAREFLPWKKITVTNA